VLTDPGCQGNAVSAVEKTADGFVVTVWNNSDAGFVDGKSYSLVAFCFGWIGDRYGFALAFVSSTVLLTT
jgi:hypothetical protein